MNTTGAFARVTPFVVAFVLDWTSPFFLWPSSFYRKISFAVFAIASVGVSSPVAGGALERSLTTPQRWRISRYEVSGIRTGEWAPAQIFFTCISRKCYPARRCQLLAAKNPPSVTVSSRCVCGAKLQIWARRNGPPHKACRKILSPDKFARQPEVT